MSQALVFDRAHHRYSVGGVAVPSVSEVLAPLYDFERVPAHVLQRAAALGTAVHRACELDDLNQLDQTALHPAWVGHLKAWRWFCADYYVSWDLIEARVLNAPMGYAGTVDRFGLVRGKPTVVDIKTSATLYPAVGPQLAAYAKAIATSDPDWASSGAAAAPTASANAPGAFAAAPASASPAASAQPACPPAAPAHRALTPPAMTMPQRLAVQLKADGNYQLTWYADAADWAVFASLLTLRRFCAQHRITPHFKERR